MNREELIKSYIEFFKSKGHKEIPNSSLIPENDPTVLFTTAGMQPLVPFLLGQTHPQGKRLTNVQRCIRTGDIEEVGDTYHHTFFEMLGNWSLGDYFKQQAIEMTFEFHTKILGIPLERYAVTVFGGDKRFPEIPKDKESESIWLGLGIPKERIAFMPEGVLEQKDNWWGPAGKTGPCGPSTEMFYWKPNDKSAPKNFNPEDSNWVEIGNNVLMEYNKDSSGNYKIAKQKNIDFGGGVERTLAVLNGFEDNYKSEVWKPIIKKIENLSHKSYEKNKKEMRIIADHIKAAVFIIADGITPSNTEQGYVLRRLIRRAVRYAKKLNLENKFTKEIAQEVIKIYSDYENIQKNKKQIFEELENEKNKFNLTLEKGLKYFNKITQNKKELNCKDAFLLYQSYGFPIEMTIELANEKEIKVDEKGFKKECEIHSELSRTASAGKFKSGLADNSKATTKLHTATHLLHAALKIILKDKTIEQRGANITPERLRFDFTFPRKLTEDEIKKIEELVNAQIQKSCEVIREEMSPQEAKTKGACGIFDKKYGEKVSVYTIGNFSKEICSGPHVKNTCEIGHFKITKEESSSSGIRRIKATVN